MTEEVIQMQPTDANDVFPKLEKDFWKYRKEFDYIIQHSPHRDELAVFKVPKSEMRKCLKQLSKQQKSKGF
mgnify:CR=1 FL=1